MVFKLFVSTAVLIAMLYACEARLTYYTSAERTHDSWPKKTFEKSNSEFHNQMQNDRQENKINYQMKFESNEDENQERPLSSRVLKLKQAHQIKLVTSDEDSSSSESSESQIATRSKVYHDTDPEQAGNGRQKPNHQASRDERQSSVADLPQDDAANHIYKNYN